MYFLFPEVIPFLNSVGTVHCGNYIVIYKEFIYLYHFSVNFTLFAVRNESDLVSTNLFFGASTTNIKVHLLEVDAKDQLTKYFHLLISLFPVVSLSLIRFSCQICFLFLLCVCFYSHKFAFFEVVCVFLFT